MGTELERRWNSGGQTFYVAEVARQATYALLALARALEQAAGGALPSETWPVVQTFLVATANISKLLWPDSDRGNGAAREWRAFRGTQLRQVLDVEDSSPLKNRDVRNSAEHFDERLDDLVRDQVLPQSWRDAESMSRLAAPQRFIDLETAEVVAGHDRMSYQPIAAELNRLVERCGDLLPTINGNLDLAEVLAVFRWPPLPPLDSPSERPDEPVTTGVDLAGVMPQSARDLVAPPMPPTVTDDETAKPDR